MAKQPVGVWGIDLGQCGLKAIRLTDNEGVVSATAFDFVEHPKILSQPDADPDQLTREALEKFLSRNQIRGDIVAIAVPGQSGLARFVKLPPVEEKKIGDIVRFEAKQQIPFNLDEVVWDYQKLNSGVVTDGFAMETEIGLFAMKRDMVNRYLQHFKDVNVDVHIVQMAPLALCNFVAYDLLKKTAEGEEGAGKKSAIVALDIGTDASNLVVTDGDRIIWQRPIPLGGNHFTRALTKDMKLTFAKAEHLKRNAIKSPDLKKILASIKPVLNDFVGEVQRSLGYFTNTHRDVQIEYMIGLGNAFRLPGLQRYLAEKLSLEVRKLEKMDRLPGESVVGSPVFNENILSFAVAYGLAVQGLKKSKLQTNLLPHEIRTERLIKGKKPFAAAAAAALLLGVGVVALAFGLEWNAFGGGPVVKATDEGKKVIGRIAAAEKAFTDAQAEAKKEEDAISSIVSGQKEQMNWLKLMKFIDDVVPRPDDFLDPPAGATATETKARFERRTAIQDLWKLDTRKFGNPKPGDETKVYNRHLEWYNFGHEAAQAWTAWRAGKKNSKLPGGKEVPLDELGPGIDYLFQFNIEAVSCRYSGNLKASWTEVLKNVKDKENNIRPKEDADKPPAEGDKGWLVELRGYTFHREQESFVLDALLERIAAAGAKLPTGWPLAAAAPKTGAEQPPPAPGAPPTAGGDDKPAGRPVSHIVLYQNSSLRTDDASNFETIRTTKLDEVLGGSAGARPGTGAPLGVGGSGKPLAAAPPSPAGGSGGNPMMPAAGGASQTGSWKPLGSETVGGGSASSAAGEKAKTSPHHRTEFVIFFIWREPSPSESLLKKPEAPATDPNAPAGPGGMQPPGGGSGPGGMQRPAGG